MSAALDDLSAGTPPHTAFGDIRADAAWWADSAAPAKLQEYHAAARGALGSRALCVLHRTRLLVTLFESLDVLDRSAFLRRVDPNGNFTGRAA